MEEKMIGIRFNEDDKEMQNAIREYFPDCKMIPSQEFEGTEILWVAIIPAAAFGLQLLEFILTHLVPKDSAKEQGKSDSDAHKKREIVCDGKSLDANNLAGKTKDEVSNIIKIKFGIELKFEIKAGKND